MDEEAAAGGGAGQSSSVSSWRGSSREGQEVGRTT